MTLPYPLNQDDLALIESDVRATWDKSEMKAFKDFQSFWNEVDVANADEEDWENEREYWRPYFYAVFTKIRGEKNGK